MCVAHRIPKRFAWSLVTAALCLIHSAFGAIAISPAYVDVRLDKGRPAGAFVVSNVGEVEERYRIQVMHFSFTPEGAMARLPKNHPNSIAEWVIFNPREFVLAPKTKRTIRFVIVPRGKLADGEYWGAMELESLNVSRAEAKDETGRQYNLSVVSSIVVPIFGQVGKIRSQGELQELSTADVKGKTVVRARAVNQGNARLYLRGKYQIIDAAGKEVASGLLGKAYVLAGGERVFATEVKEALPAGRYRLKAEYTSSQLKEPLTGETDFEWKPSAPPPSDARDASTIPAASSKPEIRAPANQETP